MKAALMHTLKTCTLIAVGKILATMLERITKALDRERNVTPNTHPDLGLDRPIGRENVVLHIDGPVSPAEADAIRREWQRIRRSRSVPFSG